MRAFRPQSGNGCPPLPLAQYRAGFAQIFQLALHRGPADAGSVGKFAGTHPGEVLALLGAQKLKNIFADGHGKSRRC